MQKQSIIKNFANGTLEITQAATISAVTDTVIIITVTEQGGITGSKEIK